MITQSILPRALPLGLLLCLWTASAQQPVASIKRNLSTNTGGGLTWEGDRLKVTNVPLTALINFAYAPANGQLMKEQVVEAPG